MALALAGFVHGPETLAGQNPGLVDLGRSDPRLKGHSAPPGFRLEVVADGPGLGDPVAMALDDQGDLFVVERRPADRAFETWDVLPLPEGGSARIRRSRRSSTDRVKRLRDGDGDGTFESMEIVLEGAEMPSAILPFRGSMLLAGSGRLERWSDEDGDGRFETRAVLIDGLPGTEGRSITGLALGVDGWLYLTTGDGDARAVASDNARGDLTRTGGVYRCRPDGSRLRLLSRGLRDPAGGLAFLASQDPILMDVGPVDGTKFQGVRLIRPIEDGDHGWRADPSRLPDPDRSAADGERPGKLGAVARLGRGAPSGLVVGGGSALPEPLRDAILHADPQRRAIRGLRVEPKGGSYALAGELTLLAFGPDAVRPIQLAQGADGALYILGVRGPAEAPTGRVYRMTWSGDGASPALPTKANHWKRVFAADHNQLFGMIVGADRLEAERALRELVDRGSASRSTCLALASDVKAPVSARLLGIQGAPAVLGLRGGVDHGPAPGRPGPRRPEARRAGTGLGAEVGEPATRRQALAPPRRPRRPGGSRSRPGNRPPCRGLSPKAGQPPGPVAGRASRGPTPRSATVSSGAWSGWARPGSTRSPSGSGPGPAPSARRSSGCSRASGRPPPPSS